MAARPDPARRLGEETRGVRVLAPVARPERLHEEDGGRPPDALRQILDERARGLLLSRKTQALETQGGRVARREKREERLRDPGRALGAADVEASERLVRESRVAKRGCTSPAARRAAA